MKDWKNKNSFINNIPKEIRCFDERTIYNKVSEICDDLEEILAKNWREDWILGSDLPYKYAVNIYIYTPFKQIKKGMKKNQGTMKDWFK